MAFNRKTFAPLGPASTITMPRWYSYVAWDSTADADDYDTLAEITADDYFSKIALMLEPGDCILCSVKTVVAELAAADNSEGGDLAAPLNDVWMIQVTEVVKPTGDYVGDADEPETASAGEVKTRIGTCLSRPDVNTDAAIRIKRQAGSAADGQDFRN